MADQNPVLFLGDQALAGTRDFLPMGNRVAAAATGAGILPLTMTFETIGQAAMSMDRVLAIRTGLPGVNLAVISFGISDAATDPNLRVWMAAYAQVILTVFQLVDRVIILLPWEISTQGNKKRFGEFDRNSRRFVQKVRRGFCGTVGELSARSTLVDDFLQGYEDRLLVIDPEPLLSPELRADAVWLKPNGYEAVAESIAAAIEVALDLD